MIRRTRRERAGDHARNWAQGASHRSKGNTLPSTGTNKRTRPRRRSKALSHFGEAESFRQRRRDKISHEASPNELGCRVNPNESARREIAAPAARPVRRNPNEPEPRESAAPALRRVRTERIRPSWESERTQLSGSRSPAARAMRNRRTPAASEPERTGPFSNRAHAARRGPAHPARSDSYANSAAAPPVCRKTTFWPRVKKFRRQRSIRPAMALPV
jgi:hypothetical protein